MSTNKQGEDTMALYAEPQILDGTKKEGDEIVLTGDLRVHMPVKVVRVENGVALGEDGQPVQPTLPAVRIIADAVSASGLQSGTAIMLTRDRHGRKTALMRSVNQRVQSDGTVTWSVANGFPRIALDGKTSSALQAALKRAQQINLP
jgi:hypothetical protein